MELAELAFGESRVGYEPTIFPPGYKHPEANGQRGDLNIKHLWARNINCIIDVIIPHAEGPSNMKKTPQAVVLSAQLKKKREYADHLPVPDRSLSKQRPLSRETALRLLRRLSLDNCKDTLSIDIGGTLAKVVLYQPRSPTAAANPSQPLLNQAVAEAQHELTIFVPELQGDFHFFVFQTSHIEDLVDFVARTWPVQVHGPPHLVVRATGGGAYKHAHAFRRAGIQLEISDEMHSIVVGLNFLLRNVPDEFFTCRPTLSPMATPAVCQEVARSYEYRAPPLTDYLYVSIGSGVSIVEVHDPLRGTAPTAAAEGPAGATPKTYYRRTGGSSLGGSTFWGLVRLLTSCSTFDEVIRLTEQGASDNVDMLVADIYGGDSGTLGLSGNVIAASFGKVHMRRDEKRVRGARLLRRYLRAVRRHYEEGFWLVLLAFVNTLPGVRSGRWLGGFVRFAEARAASVSMCGNFRAHDVALSLLRMVSNNVGQIACLTAQKEGFRQVIFGGSFIRDHPYTIATITNAVQFYSRGEVQAVFLKHDGFVGALGAHLGDSPLCGACERMPDPPEPSSSDVLRQPRSVSPDGAGLELPPEGAPRVTHLA